MKRKFAWLLPLVLCALVLGVKWRMEHLKTGLYQFAYEEKGVTIRQQQFIELHPDGQWKMYSLPLRSGLRAPQIPLTGTYKIIGQKITFQEAKQSLSIQSGPGRPSPVNTARFQGKDFFITSMENYIVISQSASNARYVKIR
jgi:hypothetical protein